MKETKALGKLRPDHYLVTTLVSTEMVRDLARREGVPIEDNLLVGFKWIAKRIDEMGPHGFLFGFEESHGYLKGTHVRDKDAAVASLLFAELAATVKDRQQTVLEYLDDLYIDVGHYGERQVNKTLEGREGVAQIQKLMAAFRANPPRSAGGLALIRGHRLQDPGDPGRRRFGIEPPMPEPKGDILIFRPRPPARGSPSALRGPSPRSSSTSSPGATPTGVSDRDKLAEIKAQTARQIDAIAADIEQFMNAALSAN